MAALILFPSGVLHAQSVDTVSARWPYWEAQPVLASLHDSLCDQSAVQMLDYRSYRYSTQETGDLVMEYTEHSRVRVQKVSAVEEYNKFYLPVSEGAELVALRARSIAPDGQVRDLSEASMRQVDDLDDLGAFRLLAMEGLVPGGEVEYVYTLRGPARLYGREVVQSDIPVLRAVLEWHSPPTLEFEARTYNGLPVAAETLSGAERLVRMEAFAIPPAIRERYALYQPHLKRVEFKLKRNMLGSGATLLSWNTAAQQYRVAVYSREKAEQKAVEKLLRALRLKAIKGNDARIAALETWVKGSVFLQESGGAELEMLDEVISSRLASELGLIRLLAAALQLADIPHQLVISADREGFPLDPDFESWSYLEEPLFHFPQSGKFLDPLSFAFRYGLLGPHVAGQHALFIQPVHQDGSGVPAYRIKRIPELTLQDHYDDLDLQVHFNLEAERIDIAAERRMSGHRASFLQPYMDLLVAEEVQQIGTELLQLTGAEGAISSLAFSQERLSDVYAGKPLVLQGAYQSEHLLERAGERWLFRAGQLIGPQVAMYQEGARRLPVDVQYPHGYRRKLVMVAPEGYSFAGTEALGQSLHFSDSTGHKLMGFEAQWTLQSDTLVAEIHEYYAITDLPASWFGSFQQVINAAADFNKISVLLEPKAE